MSRCTEHHECSPVPRRCKRRISAVEERELSRLQRLHRILQLGHRAMERKKELFGRAIVDVPLARDNHRHACGEKRSCNADNTLAARHGAGAGAARGEDDEPGMPEGQPRDLVCEERLRLIPAGTGRKGQPRQ